ncbi:MAG TPA: zf-HC2 domain-containing protein [Thermoanaerobaculia bacterium]|jgi:hypothetical protein|nr:zf-HC2 domain-containing protein [Thermoanaerobaculia bacterium]
MEHHDEVESKFAEEHQAAVKSMSAERYVLGEMEPAERDAFEEHFFDCAECSSDVRDETKIGAGVRRVEPANNLTRWAIAAAVVIAVGGAYLWPPHQPPTSIGKAIRVVAAEQPIELDSSRGPNDVRKVRADQPVGLYFVIPPPDHPLPLYTCELQDAAGGNVQTITVTRKDAENTVRMPLKAQTLRGGKYKVVIRGGDREIAEYPFTVEVR